MPFKQYQNSLLFFLLNLSFVYCQNPEAISPQLHTYGVDEDLKVVVWNHSIHNESEKPAVTKITFKNQLAFDLTADQLNYSQAITNNEGYRLYITKFPVISIFAKDSIVDEPKKFTNFHFADRDTILSSGAGIELRGNVSLSFPKKSYDISFWANEDGKEKIDLQFENLRKDDDWILDGMYNEPLRLRSYLASKLWLKLYKPHYLDKEPKAKSGIDMCFVEVFINNKYHGIFTLTEDVDRKLLKLKRNEAEKVRGELFKATAYEGAPQYEKAPDFERAFPHWAGYQMKYPVIDYTYYWKNLHDFTKFVIEADPESFKTQIAEKMVMQNLIDYYLFVNMLWATDNVGKNVFMAKYDMDEPYFIVPWDLDGIWGLIIDGAQVPITDEILSNGLYDRLLKENPDAFKAKLKDRWKNLRQSLFSSKALLAEIDTHYTEFEVNKIYEREQLAWSPVNTPKQDYDYLVKYLKERLVFLDTYFEKL